MAKPTRPTDRPTELMPSGGKGSSGADMDNMMTTIRTRIAGRLVIIDGPGKGQSLDFFHGSNSIGRDASKNVIAIDFGDAAIHREPHAYLTYSGSTCTLADSGKQNPVRLNGRHLSGTETVKTGDEIAIGMTKLRLELA